MKDDYGKPRTILSAWPRFGIHPHPWQPRADVYRHADGWLAKFELAGVARDDITVIRKLGRLTIKGLRRDLTVQEGDQTYSMEILYNEFVKVIEFPCNIETADIELEFHDGMLFIHLKTDKTDEE